MNNEIIQYPSILIWYSWLKYSLINLSNYPLGMGPFGWIDIINNSHPISLCKGDIDFVQNKWITYYKFNKRDLASFTSFGLASFGVLFPMFYFSLLQFLCKFLSFYFRIIFHSWIL